MSRPPSPAFATAATAARLLDMTRAEFLDHVHAGRLPPATYLERWDVEALTRSMRMAAMPPPARRIEA